jgi:hypothetical protein
LAKQSKTAQFAIVKGILEDEPITPEDGENLDDYQKEVRAAMDARKVVGDRPATANDWTLEFNKIEKDLAELRAKERGLNAIKEALQRLIAQYLQSNNLTNFSMNGFAYTESFKPVASVTDKAALVDHVLKTNQKGLLSVHSSTLNGWVNEAILRALEELANAPAEVDPALAELGIEAGDERGKENLGTEGRKEIFLRLLEKVTPPGVKATGRTSLSRRKA